jgi:hypothetical protein
MPTYGEVLDLLNQPSPVRAVLQLGDDALPHHARKQAGRTQCKGPLYLASTFPIPQY